MILLRLDLHSARRSLWLALGLTACAPGAPSATTTTTDPAQRAEDPALRRVLQQIADDEQRHAELGWRFVQWALARAHAELRAHARAVFASAIAGARATAFALAAAPGEPELYAHGVIDAPLRAAIWDRGLRELVVPSALALAVAAA